MFITRTKRQPTCADCYFAFEVDILTDDCLGMDRVFVATVLYVQVSMIMDWRKEGWDIGAIGNGVITSCRGMRALEVLWP